MGRGYVNSEKRRHVVVAVETVAGDDIDVFKGVNGVNHGPTATGVGVL